VTWQLGIVTEEKGGIMPEERDDHRAHSSFCNRGVLAVMWQLGIITEEKYDPQLEFVSKGSVGSSVMVGHHSRGETQPQLMFASNGGRWRAEREGHELQRKFRIS